MLDEVAGLQLRHRLSKLLLRIHNDGSVPGDRLFDRLTRDQQEPDALVAGSYFAGELASAACSVKTARGSEASRNVPELID